MADIGALLEAGRLFVAADPSAYDGYQVIEPKQAERCRRLFNTKDDEQ